MAIEYTCELEIDLPRERVIALFDSVENLYKWQKGLQSFEHVSGEPGQVGAVSKLTFNNGGRKMEMVETITRRELPERFDGLYTMKNVRNVNGNRFVEVAPGRTKWISEQVFEFSGFMKLFGLLFRGAFPKQTQKFMQAFKDFAEKGTDVRQSR